MKLHFGCGNRYLPGYIHVDAQPYNHVKYQCDVTDQSILEVFPDSNVEEIYACHIFEHIPRQKIIPTLYLWKKILKEKGILRLSVPDFESIVKLYNHNSLLLHTDLSGLLYGGQKNQWDYHTFTYDLENIKRLLNSIGFEDVKRYDWRTFLPNGYDDYSRCYIPHMDDKNGQLMSLNITCIKSKEEDKNEIQESIRMELHKKISGPIQRKE